MGDLSEWSSNLRKKSAFASVLLSPGLSTELQNCHLAMKIKR